MSILKIVRNLTESGKAVNSDRAKCIFLSSSEYRNSDGSPLPLLIQKSDGGYLYATTDLAALKHRAEVEMADRIIYVTDAGQAQHFKMVFEAARETSLVPRLVESNIDLVHVPFGLVMGEDGKKIKSRAVSSTT